MYEPLLLVHSLIRWALLFSMAWFLLLSLRGWIKKENWGPRQNHFLWAFDQAFGYQVLFGITLWIGGSPFVKSVFMNWSSVGEPLQFFWFFRHGFTMLLSFGFWHFMRAKIRKAKNEDKFKLAFWTFFSILIFVLSAIPWPWLSYGRPWLRWHL